MKPGKSYIIFCQSCQKHNYKREWVRKSWKPLFEKRGIPVFFSVGGFYENIIRNDELNLRAPDSYDYLFEKTKEACKVLLDREWDYLIKTDDDVVFDVDQTMKILEEYQEVDFCFSQYCGAFCIIKREYVQSIVSDLSRPTRWTNYEEWEGLMRHVPRERRSTILPDDMWYKNFLCSLPNIKKEEIPHTLFIDRKELHKTDYTFNYFGIHNFREEKDFMHHFKRMNSL
jgi:hypothetical protein